MTLRTLSLPLKVLATCFLLTTGIGYLFALAYLYLIELEPHAKDGLSVIEAVVVKYYGKREASRLEASLEGAMGEYISQPEKERITRWINEGAGEAEFADVQPILSQACGSCQVVFPHPLFPDGRHR